jgi:glycerophosphoryl diester phosphodiesterase
MSLRLIAHRGEPVNWPENSLAGYRAVLEAGAAFIETDVQITADGVAVLCHDPSVLKITGTDLPVAETDYATLRALSAGYPDRFGIRYQDLVITRLDELVDLIRAWPDCRVFVELKQISLTIHGITTVIDTVMDIIQPILSQAIVISFNHDALARVRDNYHVQIGWALHEWSDVSQQMAASLSPDYLFVNRTRLPGTDEPLWPGPWQWVIYTVNNADEIPAFIEQGFQLVETDEIRKLLKESRLANHPHD